MPDEASGLCFLTAFMQYVADNVDHNIHSLDGRRSFHGMGIIAASTCVTDDVQFL